MTEFILGFACGLVQFEHNMVGWMRFKYYTNSQMIVDTLTDERITENQKTCDLLNKIDKRANDNAEKYFDALKKNLEVEQVLGKYGITSLKKLDQVLLNQRVW